MSRTRTKPAKVTTNDVPVRLRCLACSDELTVLVATRGRLAAMTHDQRDRLDEFTREHAAVQVARRTSGRDEYP